MLMYIYVSQYNSGLLFHEHGSKLKQGGSSMQVDNNFKPSTFIKGSVWVFEIFPKWEKGSDFSHEKGGFAKIRSCSGK